MIWVRKLLGWVLVAMAAYFIKPLFHGQSVGTIVFALVILAAGVHLGFIDRTAGTFRAFGLLKKTVGIGAVALAVYMAVSIITIGPGVVWHSYSEEKVEQAVKMGKPIIIDFYADWCAPCRDLEHITFHDPKVVKAAGSFSMLKVDLTRKGDPLHQMLLERYPHFTIARFHLGVIYARQGKQREAEEEFRRVLLERPQDVAARFYVSD